MKASELFEISALILLVMALVARFISHSDFAVTITWRGTGYVIPPSTICIALATVLCFFATVYSLWMLPFNRTATLFHFWLTAVGIGVFWLAFYQAGAALPNSRTALWIVFAAPAMVFLTQVIFVWNLIQALAKATRLHG